MDDRPRGQTSGPPLGWVSGWRKIESAPKDGTPILATNVRMPRVMQVVSWIGNPHNSWRNWDGRNPTHWMPLPSPPGEQ